MARHWFFRLPVVRGVVALGESLAIGFRALAISANYAAAGGGRRGGRDGALARRAHLRVRARDRLRDLALQGRRRRCSPTCCRSSNGVWFVLVEGAIRVTRLRPLPGPDLAAARPAPRLPVPRRRAQGDQRLRGRRGAEPGARPALQPDPPALRHGVPALGDGDRDLRLRVLRPARLVLADREPDPAAAGDRRARLRADPLRRQAHRQPRRDDAARAGPLAAAADDARADASTSSRSRSARSGRCSRSSGRGRYVRARGSR